ncbi:MAG TPA: hypothetical protein VG734_00250 [Lacunisphaera sp.]|nr:hypothetical protein [Lacunisphaera sp.]
MNENSKVTRKSARKAGAADPGQAGVLHNGSGTVNDTGRSTALIDYTRNMLLLFLGPTAAGKSTLIRKLASLDPRFQYVVPFTTRELRVGETDKVRVSAAELDVMEKAGQLLARNRIYGHEYGTPKGPIEQSLRSGCFPCLDWPVQNLDTIAAVFPGRMYRIYIAPPSLAILHRRLKADGRDPSGTRFVQARAELHELWSGNYNGLIDFIVVSDEAKIPRVAQAIRAKVLSETL